MFTGYLHFCVKIDTAPLMGFDADVILVSEDDELSDQSEALKQPFPAFWIWINKYATSSVLHRMIEPTRFHKPFKKNKTE